MYLDTTLQRTNFESAVHVASSMCLSLIHSFVTGTDIHGSYDDPLVSAIESD